MKTKGDLYEAVKNSHIDIEGVSKKDYSTVVFHYAKLGKDKYLVVFDSIFRKDPIKRRYSIVSEKRFRKICEGCNLQTSV